MNVVTLKDIVVRVEVTVNDTRTFGNLLRRRRACPKVLALTLGAAVATRDLVSFFELALQFF